MMCAVAPTHHAALQLADNNIPLHADMLRDSSLLHSRLDFADLQGRLRALAVALMQPGLFVDGRCTKRCWV